MGLYFPLQLVRPIKGCLNTKYLHVGEHLRKFKCDSTIRDSCIITKTITLVHQKIESTFGGENQIKQIKNHAGDRQQRGSKQFKNSTIMKIS